MVVLLCLAVSNVGGWSGEKSSISALRFHLLLMHGSFFHCCFALYFFAAYLKGLDGASGSENDSLVLFNSKLH